MDSIPSLQALAFFDLFDRPLTDAELAAFAWRGARALPLPEAVEQADGWNALGGLAAKRALVTERAELAVPLVARARAFAALCTHIPYLRGVFLVNSLALGTNRAGSDIDLLIVARRGRIWFVRALVSLLAQVRGWRRHGDKIAGRICLSFFITDDALDLSGMRLPAGDPYLAYWVASAIPLAGSIGAKELRAANPWLIEDLPGLPDVPATVAVAVSPFERVLHTSGAGWAGDRLARLAFRLWRRRRGRDDAAADDRMQKFHDTDRRAEFRGQWRTLCAALDASHANP